MSSLALGPEFCLIFSKSAPEVKNMNTKSHEMKNCDVLAPWTSCSRLVEGTGRGIPDLVDGAENPGAISGPCLPKRSSGSRLALPVLAHGREVEQAQPT